MGPFEKRDQVSIDGEANNPLRALFAASVVNGDDKLAQCESFSF